MMYKNLILSFLLPIIVFSQTGKQINIEKKQIELRKNEKIIMSEKWSLFKPVKGKGKLFLQPGNVYLTNERFYFTTIKKAMGTKHFFKSFDFEEIKKISNATYEKEWGFKIILKNGKRHKFIIHNRKNRLNWIKQIKSKVFN